jgi:hypothetical protein
MLLVFGFSSIQASINCSNCLSSALAIHVPQLKCTQCLDGGLVEDSLDPAVYSSFRCLASSSWNALIDRVGSRFGVVGVVFAACMEAALRAAKRF